MPNVEHLRGTLRGDVVGVLTRQSDAPKHCAAHGNPLVLERMANPLILVRLALPRRGETGAAPTLLDSARRTRRNGSTLPTRSSSHARATATSTTPAWCRGSSTSSHSPLGRSLLSRSASLRRLQRGSKTNPRVVQTPSQQHTRRCFRGNPDSNGDAAPSATCSVATQPCAPAGVLLV